MLIINEEMIDIMYLTWMKWWEDQVPLRNFMHLIVIIISQNFAKDSGFSEAGS